MKEAFKIIRLILILMVVGFTMTHFVCTTCWESPRRYILVGLFSSSVWIALWLGNAYVSSLVSRYYSWTDDTLKRFIWGLVSTVAYTLGSVYIITALFNLITNFKVNFAEDMMYSTVAFTFAISLFMHGKGFLENWRKASLDAATLKKESAVARYEMLKSQVNPHFLFNSLNALTNLILEDQQTAVKFVKQLSEVYRYVLDTRDREMVSLDEELKFIRSYIYLQELRFGSNLQVQIDVSPVNVFIAPLALQMLVENAIKHNVISTEHPLVVNIYLKEKYIVVENNVQKKKIIVEASQGIGLANIRNRYKFLTDKEVLVEQQGEKFFVSIPVIEQRG